MMRKRKSAVKRVAIIGCGAVTELCHLPAARRVPEVEIVVLVDRNIGRAKDLCCRFGIAHCAEDYRHWLGEVDGAIVALPHHLHAPVTIELLESGMPVLVEKPMALSHREAEAMVNTARSKKLPLQVGLMYHFCEGARVIKRAIEEGWLGRIQSFNIEWCFIYDWPVASGFFFNKEQSGGGVLVDFGSHVLDLLLWWIGDVLQLDYRDDSLGGVEAECGLSLTLQGPQGPVKGRVVLSRLRRLPYRARVTGEHLTIECDISAPTSARMWPTSEGGREAVFALDTSPLPPQSLDDAYAEQLRSFAQAIRTGERPVVSGDEVLKSVALIERCYRERKPLQYSWTQALPPPVIPPVKLTA